MLPGMVGIAGFSGAASGPILADTWKLVSRNQGDNGTSFTTGSEMKWLDSLGAQISTSGATHTGSAPQSGTPSLLFNGNLTDFYQSGVTSGYFVQTVFAAPVTVAGVAWLPLAGFAVRCPVFFDVYYNQGAGDVYAFSGAHTWSGNTEQTFMDPGLGAQTDWLIAALTCNGGGVTWSAAEIEFRDAVGGTDLTPGGTAFVSPDVTVAAASVLIDNNLATHTGTTAFKPYAYMGCRLSSAFNVPQAALVTRAGANATESMVSGGVYAGANRGFRLRQSFSGLANATDPTTSLINM